MAAKRRPEDQRDNENVGGVGRRGSSTLMLPLGRPYAGGLAPLIGFVLYARVVPGRADAKAACVQAGEVRRVPSIGRIDQRQAYGLIRDVTRSPRPSPHVLVVLTVLLVLSGNAGWSTPAAFAQPPVADFAIPVDDQIAGDADLTVSDVPPTADELPTLSQIRDDTWAQVGLLPESEWSIAALAEALHYDPQAAFTFVRDSIAFDPYAGVLRGAQGTLAARAGNSHDRALLLGALLDAMSVPYRFAFADLSDEDAAAVLARASRTPTAPLGTAGIALTTTIDAVALDQRARRDYARLLMALDGALDDTPSGVPGPALEAVRHHAWIEAAFGSEWQDLDPTFEDAVAGSTFAPAASTADSLPMAAMQNVDLRMVAESLSNGVLSEQVVLERSFDAATAASSTIFLYFQPDATGLGATITDVLSGDVSWVPVLMVDRVTQTGSAFHVGGRGSDVFGTATDAPELASLRLEVETSGPGLPPITGERILLDRVPDELRGTDTIDVARLQPLPEDDAGPFIMGQFHHLMVSTGGADRRDHALQRSASADFIGRLLEREDLWDAFALPDLLWPVAATDEELVVASETALVPALGADGDFRAFVARPRATLTTFGRDSVDPAAMAFATDLMIDGVAVLPRGEAEPGEAARRRLWYGSLETALETQFALGHAVLLDPNDRSSSGASLADVGALTLLRPEDAGTVPDGTSPVLRRALEDGLLVMTSGDPAGATAWWTVDPATGETRSILDPGLGGIVPSGRPSPTLRTFDSSYTHGGGARLPQRPPMQRPPGGYGGGSGGAATPSTCTSGDSTGYIALTSCISIPVSLARWLLFSEVATIITFIAYFALR